MHEYDWLFIVVGKYTILGLGVAVTLFICTVALALATRLFYECCILCYKDIRESAEDIDNIRNWVGAGKRVVNPDDYKRYRVKTANPNPPSNDFEPD